MVTSSITERITIGDALRRHGMNLPALSDKASVRDHLSAPRILMHSVERIRINGEGSGKLNSDIVERVRLRSKPVSLSHVTSHVRERVRLRGRAAGRVRIHSAIVERLRMSASDSKDSSVTPQGSDSADKIGVRIRTSSHVRLHSNIVERLRMASADDRSSGTAASDKVKLTAKTTHQTRLNTALVSRVGVRSSMASPLLAHMDVVERIRIGARHSVQARVPVHVREKIFITPVIAAEGRGLAFTADMRSFALSRYEDFPAQTMAGGLIGGHKGLWAKSDVDVEARIETGELDFASGRRKTVPWLYVHGKEHAGFKLHVTADTVPGKRVTTAYKPLQRNTDDYRPARVQVGKGYYSSYYKVTFECEAAFEVSHIEAVLAMSRRRV